MAKTLRHLKISTRLALSLVVAVVGALTASVVAVYLMYQTILDDHEETLRRFVDMGVGVARHWYAREQAGTLTIHEAQLEAVHELQSLRHGGNEFFILRQDASDEADELRGKRHARLNTVVLGPPELADRFAGAVGGEFVSARDPTKRLFYLRDFAPWEWAIGTSTDIGDLDVLLRRSLLWVIPVNAIVLAIALVLGWDYRRTYSMRLATLSGKMEELASGNLFVDLDTDVDQSGEIGELVRAMESLRESEKRRLQKKRPALFAAAVDVGNRIVHLRSHSSRRGSSR